MLMSDRIAVMSGGHIHQFASPEAVYNAPATAFVADFVGQVNELSPAHPALALPVGGRAIIRPERLRIGPAPEGALVFEGRLEELRFSGDTIFVHVASDAGLLIASRKNTGEALDLPIGSNLPLWCRTGDIVAFDAQGKSL